MELSGWANTSRSTRLGPAGRNGAGEAVAPRSTPSPILVNWRPSMIRSSAFTSSTIHLYRWIGNDGIASARSARAYKGKRTQGDAHGQCGPEDRGDERPRVRRQAVAAPGHGGHRGRPDQRRPERPPKPW